MRKPGSVAAARAASLVARFTSPLQEVLDTRLVRALTAAVTAACMGSPLTLTSLGRWLPSRVLPKHAVKRMDRLLGNKRLHEALAACWAAVARLPEKGRLVLLMDWTGANDGKQCWVLSASIAAEGRAVPLYDALYDKREYDSPQARQRFLLELARIIPPGREVTIIADAGFRVPFLKQVTALGWDYIVRLRGRTYVRLDSGKSLLVRSLHPRATLTATSLGPVDVGQGKRAFRCQQLVLFRTRRKGRKAKDRLGRVRRWQRSREYAGYWRQPWVLLTSLHDPADRLRHLYGLRMTIEQTFRDLKNPRLGMGFAQSASRTLPRVRVLWLIGVLAMRICRAAGELVERTSLLRGLQVNTVSDRRVLSQVRLGAHVLACLLAPLRGLLPLPKLGVLPA